ncbi:MAG: hypothetical protein ACK551_07660 [Vampirovibrionales bacterium]|jgi:hypothetical protein
MQAKKNNGKTLTLFLVQGDSTGSIQVGIKGDTLKLVSLPKNHLSDYMSESDIGRGFYLLVQQNPNVAQPFSVYVGESKDLLTRMTRHKADTNKEFERIILAYTSDNELNTDHTRYIEETLIKFCKIHPLVDSTNGNNGQASPLQPSDKAYCDNLLEQFVLVLSALGYYFIQDWELEPHELKARYASMPVVTAPEIAEAPLMETKIDTTNSDNPFKDFIFQIKNKKDGFVAYLKVLGQREFVLQIDSTVRGWNMPSNDKKDRLETLHKISTPVEGTRLLKLDEELTCTSPSGAGQFVNGTTCAGFTEWKTAEGETLEAVNARLGDPLGRNKG